ncbi:transglycosylase SLT domain-containing protein [Paucibacter sp. TC2R-5]|uniref:transglycosylase SLT domain-containing protein n=1 Tax=Paucibacter sp. TC2R-5 TaxID=2893555 RepID=UPI0021E47E99|nr:transglycosylase SLT domain-containing protein [Paucibacter sp. TC2R-5]MCV2359649.1 transglycosylase SLT domain-containing protein [Paucibacter sp. TC2R-5]
MKYNHGSSSGKPPAPGFVPGAGAGGRAWCWLMLGTVAVWGSALAALALLAAWALLLPLLLVLSATAQAQGAPELASPPAAAHTYRAALLRASQTQWGLDAPVAVLAAQVHQESGWNPAAVSRAGARGMAQFMPATAAWWCARPGSASSPQDCQPDNPTWALRALAGYDKWLWDRLPADLAEADRVWAMLRAYNGGLGHWQAESALAGSTQRLKVDAACGRARRNVQFCDENLSYPRRIMVVLQPRYGAWGKSVWVRNE